MTENCKFFGLISVSIIFASGSAGFGTVVAI